MHTNESVCIENDSRISALAQNECVLGCIRNCELCSIEEFPLGWTPHGFMAVNGRLAQLVARFLHTEEVISSSLVSPT